MTKLETLIKLNNLEKQNRRIRLENKLKQQEYYDEIEKLFDPLTRTLNANNEYNLALSEQTLRAIDQQNQVLDKQTKMIQQAGFQIGETASQMGETASRISKNTSKINETLKGTIKETQDIAPVFVETKTANVLHLMGGQTNPQLILNLVDLPTRRYKMNDVDVTLEQGAFLVKDNTYEFSDRFFNFLTKSNVTYDDNIEEDENKIKRFLKDIRYDVGRGDKKRSRYRTIKRILMGKDGVFGKDLTKDKLNNHDNHSYKIDPNNLVERLGPLILETEAGHDEMLDISKQLLFMNIINQEQLDNFVFNYGK